MRTIIQIVNCEWQYEIKLDKLIGLVWMSDSINHLHKHMITIVS